MFASGTVKHAFPDQDKPRLTTDHGLVFTLSCQTPQIWATMLQGHAVWSAISGSEMS